MQNPEEMKAKGLALFRQGAHDEALAAFATAVTAYTAREDELGRAEMLNNMGVIYRVKREFDKAAAVLTEAETIFTRHQDDIRLGETLANQGDLSAAQRQAGAAARFYSQAAALLARQDSRAQQSQVLRALSLLRLRQGRWLEAMMRMEESLTAAPRISLGGRLLRRLIRIALGLLGSW